MCEPENDPEAEKTSSTRSSENENATTRNENAVTNNDVVESGKAHRFERGGGLFLATKFSFMV
jgi:hypothetical protein